MSIIVKEVEVKDWLSRSGLSDFVINPYIGCPHACRYCYAQFMSKYTKHSEGWGNYLDVKKCHKPIDVSRLVGKSVLMSSVTDPYNPFEAKYRVTKGLLQQLAGVNCHLTLLTKSALAYRDIDDLKKIKDLTFAMSINTMDETFRADMDRASPISERLATLRAVHAQGIRTVIFIAPIFYGITSVKAIFEASHEFIDEYWLDGLNMRGPYRNDILRYLKEKYPNLYNDYYAFYVLGHDEKLRDYFQNIAAYCKDYRINCQLFFGRETQKEPVQGTLF